MRNADYRHARDRAYYHSHKVSGSRKDYYKAWYQRNKERIRAQHKEYGAIHRAEGATRTLRYKSRKHHLEATLSNEQWEIIKSLFKQKCAYCGKRTRRLEREHVIPVANGGSFTMHNIVPSCRQCNAEKHTGLPVVPVALVLL